MPHSIRPRRLPLASAMLALAAAMVPLLAEAAPVTYSYSGPALVGHTESVTVSFTTSAPLAASRSYLAQADAGVTASNITVKGPAGTLTNFVLPVQTFQVHTNASGAIDSWFILGDFNTLTGTAPQMSGVDRQAYTMNTMVFIPGSDIPGATGLVTGPYMYDQATETTFYPSCLGAPPGCTLAGNGQPYVGGYSGIINPSNTNGSWWQTGSVTPPPPPPPPVTVSVNGSLPNGVVGQGYTATLSASGGTAPYLWSAAPLPPGLTMRSGTVAGTPTKAGTWNVAVTATDTGGAVGSASYAVTIVPSTCSGSNGVITSVGRDFIVVNGGTQLGDHVWYTPTPQGTTFTGGTTGFVNGELVDWVGNMDAVSGCHATSMTVKPAAVLSCTPPAGATLASGKGTVTATGSNWFATKQRHVDYANCTKATYHNGNTAPAVGDKAEWKGWIEPNGNVMATRMTMN